MPTGVAVITGAGSGLGFELAASLAAKDYFIVGVSRRPPSDQRWIELKKSNRVEHVSGDVALDRTVNEAFDKAERGGDLRLVINCAGRGIFGPVGSYRQQDLSDVLGGNLVGTILFSEAGFSRMRNSGGAIVNVMSTAAHVARVNEAIYCASKWGARGYTESLRLEAKGTPVKIFAVYPGGMNTRFWDDARGVKIDSAKFMPASEVAAIIVDTIEERDNSYISDIIINRK